MTKRGRGPILGALAACALAALALWQTTHLHSTPAAPADLAAGDALPPVVLDAWRLEEDGRQTRTGSAGADRLFGGRCGVMVFFDARCHGCEVIAPRWNGHPGLGRSGTPVDVAWIALQTDDTAEAGFVARQGLPRAWFALRSRDDRLRLGVVRWPAIYLVDGAGRLVSSAGYFPEDFTVPPACGTAVDAAARD